MSNTTAVLRVLDTTPDFQTRLIKHLLAFKDRPLEIERANPDVDTDHPYILTLVDGKLHIEGFHNIVTYIDERYPYPQALPTTPEHRALSRNLLDRLLTSPKETLATMHSNKPKNGFFFGLAPGILDLAVVASAPGTNWGDYPARVEAAIAS